jgi:hypothetical protein
MLENIEIVDINAEHHLPKAQEWLMKTLTEEKPTSSVKKSAAVPGRHRHQITYLAAQVCSLLLSELSEGWIYVCEQSTDDVVLDLCVTGKGEGAGVEEPVGSESFDEEADAGEIWVLVCPAL